MIDKVMIDSLIRLASLGAAGVSVIAVVLVGRAIYALSDHSPMWKVSLMQRYQNFCIVIALICAISGFANAYIKLERVQASEEYARRMETAIESQTLQFDKLIDQLSKELTALQQQVAATPTPPNNGVRDRFDALRETINEMRRQRPATRRAIN
jgi:uncharacterized protein (DUF488 family)